MSLAVGIHSNLVFSKAAKNDRGSLLVGFKEAGEIDFLSSMNSGSGSTSFRSNEQDFLIYPPRLEDNNSQVDTFENIMKKIAEVKDPLTHILSQYLTSDKIQAGWDIFKGTNVTKENLMEKVRTATVLDKIYSNIVDQFIKMATPFVGDDTKLRMLFVRQSKAKHFPALRRKFLDGYPFAEPMSIPESSSRLRYSKYEVDNGLDSGQRVDGATVIAPSDAQAQDALFTN